MINRYFYKRFIRHNNKIINRNNFYYVLKIFFFVSYNYLKENKRNILI